MYLVAATLWVKEDDDRAAAGGGDRLQQEGRVLLPNLILQDISHQVLR